MILYESIEVVFGIISTGIAIIFVSAGISFVIGSSIISILHCNLSRSLRRGHL